MPLGERQPEPKVYAARGLFGLELDAPEHVRPVGSFQLLENFELTRAGTIRKFRGIEQIAEVVYDTPIVAVISYKGSAARKIYGLAQSGKMYDLVAGTLAVDFGVSFGAEARIVVYEGPANDVGGGSGQAVHQYLLVFGNAGQPPYRWDPEGEVSIFNTNPAQIGVDPPTTDLMMDYAFVVSAEHLGINTTPYIQPLIAKQFQWTFYNRALNHDSSPSPVGPISVFTPQSYVQIIEPVTYQIEDAIVGIQLRVDLTDPTIATAQARGYHEIRLWETRDGSEEFYLVTDFSNYTPGAEATIPIALLIIEGGRILLGANRAQDGNQDFFAPDGSLISTPYVNTNLYNPTDIGGLPPGGIVPFERSSRLMYDPELVDFAPLDGQNDPPADVIWGTVYQNRLVLIDAATPSKLVFSKSGEFSSFPSDNFITMLVPSGEPLTAVETEFASLMMGRAGSLSRMTGVDFQDFAVTSVDAQVGIIARRLVAAMAGRLYFVSRRGIEYFMMDMPQLIGERIDPLIERLQQNLSQYGVMAVDAQRGNLMLAGTLDSDVLMVVMDSVLAGGGDEGPSPFSTFRIHEGQSVTAMSELIYVNEQEEMVLALNNKRVYLMHKGNSQVSAQAITNPIPQDDYQSDKTFQILRMEPPTGNEDDFRDFQFRYSVDGRDFSPLRPLRRYNRIGARGRTIRFGFTHFMPVALDVDDVPMLGDMYLEYTRMDEGR